VKFFNDIAAVSETWYAEGAQEPGFVYTIRPLPADNIEAVGFRIDGQALNWSSGTLAPKQFTWHAQDRNEAVATVRFGGGADISWANKQGLWSVFQFFGEAENRHVAGNVETLEWVIRIGKDPAMVAGKPLTVRVELGMAGAPPVFQKGFFSRLGCVAEVAK
jgi:type VI protein secretion system component VasK